MFWRLRAWTRALLRREHIEREMRDELRDHLDRATERLVARGLSAAEARAEAHREFGNLTRVQEEARDARGVRWIEEIAQDARYGARGLVRSPAFSIVAIASLVLGIGLNTAIFTTINGILSVQVIDDPRSFVTIQQTWSYPAYERLRAQTPALSALIARSDEGILLAPIANDGEPQRVAAELVSSNYFTALRASTALGRTFGASDETQHVGVLNYRFWKADLADDSSALGRVFRLANGTTFTVIGIAHRDFSGVRRGGPDVWLPIGMRPALPVSAQGSPRDGAWFSANDHGWLTLYGRLAPGQSAEVAQTQVNVALRQLAASDSSFAPGPSRTPLKVVTADAGRTANSQRFLKAALIGGTLLVLLVACFNVAGLMLARAADREREIAVRLCLGAARARIIRQLITESAIVVGVSAVLAFVLSRWTLRAMALSGGLGFISDDAPERLAHALRSDWRVFAFSLAMGALGVACCGLVPALRATRPDLANAVKADRRGPSGSRPTARTVLTIAQIALSVVLLVSAALLTRSVSRALRFDLGFERGRVLQVASALNMAGFDSVRVHNVSRDLEQRIGALPGVTSVARGDVPIVGGRFRTTLIVAGSSTATHDGYIAAVTPSYFTTLGIPIVRGRAFTDEELQSRAQVVVVSEATARTLWPNDDPIGKTVGVDPKKKGTLAPETRMPAAVVVGVARDAQMVEIAEIPPVYVYAPSARGELLVRADGDVRALVAPIRALWRSVAPSAPVSSVPLSELIAENGGVYDVRFAAGFATVLGALALVLASVGIFGLMAYSVSKQTRELGVRMALGASASDVMSHVLGQGSRVAAIGVVVGLLGGFGATRVISSLLFGMSPLDLPAYAGVVVLIAAVAVIACYLPARRATRIDPLVALKTE